LAGAEQHLTRLDLTIDHRLREHRALVVIERREQTDLGQERWVDRHAPRISGSLPPCLDGSRWCSSGRAAPPSPRRRSPSRRPRDASLETLNFAPIADQDGGSFK